MNLHCAGVELLTFRYCAGCNRPPDTFSNPNDIRPNKKCEPSHADDYAASGSTYEDDPSPEVQAVRILAASGVLSPDAHQTTLQGQADWGHNLKRSLHIMKCHDEDVGTWTNLEVKMCAQGR
jgi:hypothetical protein